MLARKGGNNPNQVVYKMVDYLFTDTLMMESTFKGMKNGGVVFKNTNLMKGIYGKV